MVDVFVRMAKPKDCLIIARAMRKCDVAEVMASAGLNPHDAVRSSFDGSDTCAVFCTPKGIPFAMYGVGSQDIGDGTRALWMLATDQIDANQVAFLRLSKEIIGELVAKYGKMSNFVHAQNKVTQKWLKWLGARFEKPIEFGVSGEAFIRFEIGGGS